MVVNHRLVWEQAIDGEFGFREFSAVMDLTAGRNILELVSKCPGAAPRPNGSRQLAIAVKNLLSWNEEGTTRFQLDE